MSHRLEVRRAAIAAVLSTTVGLGALLASTVAHAAGAWVNTATQAMPLKNIVALPPSLPRSACMSCWA